MVTSLNARAVGRDLGYQMSQYICGRLTLGGADASVRIGGLPAGSVILGIQTRVVLAVTGGTPVLNVGSVTPNAAAPTFPAGADLATGITITTGSSTFTMPAATTAEPFTTDRDVWIGSSGAATAGDVVVAVHFIKPLS